MDNNNEQFLLEIKGLKTHFFTEDGTVKAVDGVDFNVKAGEILGLVGESGCGKSVTALSIMQLIGIPGKIIEGEINFGDLNLRELSVEDIQDIRGNKISMIFQQPQSSLNPIMTIGDQVAEVFEIHSELDKEDITAKLFDLICLKLQLALTSKPASKSAAFAGLQQRVMDMAANL